MSAPTETVREEILAPIRRVLTWLASLRDTQGRIWCPEHAVEHTGKSAGAIVMACELAKLDPAKDGPWLRELAVQQAERLVANLVREGDSPCHTFRPGRHDPFNCSNSVIDGGAASDALAHLVTELGGEIDPVRARAFRDASLLHARTYLRYAVLDKGVPAQRAWGLTGLAGAHALERDADLERAALEGIALLEKIQHADGSYPYHPIEWGAEHPGSSDVSSFYQSRVTGFVLYALERLRKDPRDARFRLPLERGLDFLVALAGPDGIKCGLVEAKPWYWGASYEVASHPFDVYALATGWRLFRKPGYARAASAAFRAWSAHLEPDGRPTSHHADPGRERSYQCPLFWASHGSWLARAARDLESIANLPIETDDEATSKAPRVAWFPDAQLARLENANVVAWVRGKRPAVNVHHGSPHGAGLLRVYDKREKRDLIERRRLCATNEGEWSASAGLPSLARGWRSGARELRFSLWMSRVHARAHRTGAVVAAPIRVLRRGVFAFGSREASSAFDWAPDVEVWKDGVGLSSSLAHRDGTRVAGNRVRRSFRIDGAGLEVVDEIVEPGAARDVRYELPAAARDVHSTPSVVRYRLGG
jgi:hypothetical protein